MDIKIFAERLKNAREEAGIDQVQLAEKVGVSVVILSRYENGRRKPNIEDTAKLADALDVPVSYLFGESDDATALLVDRLNGTAPPSSPSGDTPAETISPPRGEVYKGVG